MTNNPIAYGNRSNELNLYSFAPWLTTVAEAEAVYNKSAKWQKVFLGSLPSSDHPIAGCHLKHINRAISTCTDLDVSLSVDETLRFVVAAKQVQRLKLSLNDAQVPWDYIANSKLESLTIGTVDCARMEGLVRSLRSLPLLKRFVFDSDSLPTAALALLAPLAARVTLVCRGVDITAMVRGYHQTQGEREGQELALAKRLAAGGWTPFYDLVVACTPTFSSLFTDGWPVHTSQVAPDKWQGLLVSVFGEFNKGKSFVLSQLTGSPLPTGTELHTEGLSFKRLTDIEGRCLLLLDTAGVNSPITAVHEQALQEKKAEEEFLREVGFNAADVFLYVVGHVNAKEQIEIFTLSKQLEVSQKRFRKVLIVHNLKEVTTLEGLVAAWQHIKQLYSMCEARQQRVEAEGQSRVVHYLEGVESDHKYSELQTHFVIGRQGSPAGEDNAWVFAKLRNLLLDIPETRGGVHIHTALLRAMNAAISKFVRPAGEVLLAVQRLVLSPSEQPYVLKERDLSYFVSVDKHGDSGTELYEPYDVLETDRHVRVLIELPGVPGESVGVETELTPGGTKLHVRAQKPRAEVAGATVHEARRRYGELRYDINIAARVDDPEVALENGLLELTFPKAVTAKRVITIGGKKTSP